MKTKTYTVNRYIQLGKPLDIFQKRVLFLVIKDLQKEIYAKNDAKSKGKTITTEEQQKLRTIRETTIEGDCYFYIPYKLIDPNNLDNKLRSSLRKLTSIPIDDEDFIGNFLSHARRKNNQWVLLFPKETIDFLTEVSKGVTPLGGLVYMCAGSGFTVRFYEILMQFRDTGKYYTTPEELHDLLGSTVSYRKNFAKFRQAVLDIAQKELRELYKVGQSEICFEYEEKKGGRGNKVQSLVFTIFWNEKKKKPEQTDKELTYISGQLERLMITEVAEGYRVKNKEFINKALSVLIQDNCLKQFADRLEKILENPNIDDKAGYIRILLIDQYGVKP